MKTKIGVISLGCVKNRIDTELMLGELGDTYEFVQDLKDADVALINTCTFINDAKEESINAILEAEQQKKFGNLKAIIVTGCLPQRYQDELKAELPRVDAFLGVTAYNEIRDVIEKALSGEHVEHYERDMSKAETIQRIITTVKPTAYVRIADGCNNACSYCVIPSVRGALHSRKKEEILREITSLAQEGYCEIVLVAQDTTKYGVDLYGRSELVDLLEQASQIEGVKWLRLLYCYPESITDELLDVMNRHDNIVRYLDMPVQHLDDDILAAMNRKSTYAQIEALVQKIRTQYPDFVLRSTVIVGFPGETRAIARNGRQRLKTLAFDRLGVFAYSQEEGTPAAALPDQVEEEEKDFRLDAAMNTQYEVSYAMNKRRVGKTYEVLIEGQDKAKKVYYGRSEFEAPEIDGKILVKSDTPLEVGEFYKVTITSAYIYDCLGEVVL